MSPKFPIGVATTLNIIQKLIIDKFLARHQHQHKTTKDIVVQKQIRLLE